MMLDSSLAALLRLPDASNGQDVDALSRPFAVERHDHPGPLTVTGNRPVYRNALLTEVERG
jgi:hypothetical protein